MQHRFPARPHQEPYSFERPRLTDDYPDRSHRLKALGNAVLPQKIYPIAVYLAEKLSREVAR
jgi:hypothetical protein